MPKYRNIHTGEVAEWTARPELDVMEREDGVRWSIYGINQTPRFLACHELVAPPAPAPDGGNGGEEE